jgi:hypothetical protein
MAIEYIAFIAEEDYWAFKILVTTTLPRDYSMWLRVRERGKVRAIEDRAADVLEVQISPEEFGAYCKGLKRTDFGITALDRCAARRCCFERGKLERIRLRIASDHDARWPAGKLT